MSAPRKRILSLIHWYSEALHRGILAHCVEQGWDECVLTAENASDFPPGTYDGIIGLIPPPEHPLHRFVAEAPVPVVELSYSYPENTHWGRYPSDAPATGRMGAVFLRRRPAACFAFVSLSGGATHAARREGFVEGLAGDPRPCFHFETGSLDRDATGKVAAFLKGLPRPAAVFGSVDESARQVLSAAMDAGLSVPGDLYLMGFGNRDLFSRIAPVPITTIDIDRDAWGRAAAGLLGEMMDGRAVPGTMREFAPGGVIERASTGGDSGGDPLCERALEHMRRNVAEPLNVADLAAKLHIGKTTLNRAFMSTFGTGVAERYLALRIEIAKGLLVSGTKVEAVAGSVGFASCRAFRTAFRKSVGCAPLEFVRRGDRRDAGAGKAA